MESKKSNRQDEIARIRAHADAEALKAESEIELIERLPSTIPEPDSVIACKLYGTTHGVYWKPQTGHDWQNAGFSKLSEAMEIFDAFELVAPKVLDNGGCVAIQPETYFDQRARELQQEILKYPPPLYAVWCEVDQWACVLKAYAKFPGKSEELIRVDKSAYASTAVLHVVAQATGLGLSSNERRAGKDSRHTRYDVHCPGTHASPGDSKDWVLSLHVNPEDLSRIVFPNGKTISETITEAKKEGQKYARHAP